MPKIFKPITVKAGSAQQVVYGFHLANRPNYTKDGKEMKPPARVAVQIGLLRQAAACPDSANLRQYYNDSRAASWTDFTTKSAAILSTVVELIGKGEQVIIASSFQHFNERLHRRLTSAKVNACLLDGTISAQRRGEIAADFKQYRHSVMVAGKKAMGEGHSFECCAHLIDASLEWAFDINDQMIDRVHRLVSAKPVTIYPVLTTNTIDERLNALYHEKGDSSHLALDGQLFAERTEEINLAQLLADAVRDFDPHADTIDELQVEQEWPYLAKKLEVAEQQFREWHPPVARLRKPGEQMTLDDLRAAIDALGNEPAAGGETPCVRPFRQKARPKGARSSATAPKPKVTFTDGHDPVGDSIRALLAQIQSTTFKKK